MLAVCRIVIVLNSFFQKMFSDMVEEETENFDKYRETLENLIDESQTLRRVRYFENLLLIEICSFAIFIFVLYRS